MCSNVENLTKSSQAQTRLLKQTERMKQNGIDISTSQLRNDSFNFQVHGTYNQCCLVANKIK
jgi:hypothetical protein